jgi:hypothetical protein
VNNYLSVLIRSNVSSCEKYDGRVAPAFEIARVYLFWIQEGFSSWRSYRPRSAHVLLDFLAQAAPYYDSCLKRSGFHAMASPVLTDQGKTPVGSYKVDIYLNGNLDRTMNFSVTKDAAGSGDASPKTSAIGTCPKLAPANEKPPGFPMGVAVARGVDGNGKPVNPARIFRPDSGPIYAVLVGEKIPANTKVAIRWFATDTGGLEACNTQFSSNQVVATGSDNPWFSTAPPVAGTKWPEGLYRVEMDVNGNLAMVVDFGVCDGPCKFQVPIAWTLG